MKHKPIFTFILICFFALPSLANSTIGSIKGKKAVGATLSAKAFSNFYETSSVDHNAGSIFYFIPSYTMKNKMILSGVVSVSQQITDETKTVWNNTPISLSREPFKINRSWTFIPEAVAVLPTNEIDRRDSTYQGSAGLGATYSFKSKVFSNDFIANLGVSVSKNFHQYTHNAQNEANMELDTEQIIELTQGVNKVTNISFNFRHINSWAYKGGSESAFAITEKVSLAALDNVTFSIGHTNKGNALSYDGRDRNIKFFDGNTSVFFSTLSMTY